MAKTATVNPDNSGNSLNMFVLGIIVVLVLFILGYVIYKYTSGDSQGETNVVYKWLHDKEKDSK